MARAGARLRNVRQRGRFQSFCAAGVPDPLFPKGTTIFREGEQGDEFFVVVPGEVEIRGGNRHLEILGPKGIFGEWR